MKSGSIRHLRNTVGALGFVFPVIASAQVTCASLPSLSPLAGNPAVSTAAAQERTSNGRAYCFVTTTWRDPAMVGAAAGYAPGGPPTPDTFQIVRMGFALPLNTNTGALAWGGRLVMTASGSAQGNIPMPAPDGNGFAGGGSMLDMIAMDPPAIGAGSDSGHGDANSGSGDTWGYIVGVGLNMGKITDWAQGRANYVTVRLAKQLALTYYGMLPQRTYFSGFSGGGQMAWAQVMNYPEEYNGALIGSPSIFWEKHRLGDSWGAVVRRHVAQLTTPISAAQEAAAHAAALAACDTLDSAPDGFLSDPRKCTWSATNNICGVAGAPAAPACLDPIQAAGIDREFDGARNSFGKRVWHPYERGVNRGVATVAGGGTAQVMRYAYADPTWAPTNLYENQDSINIDAARGVDVSKAITYAQAAQIDQINGAQYIDLDDVTKLAKAHALGLKIIAYHGTADNQVPWRGDISFYTRAATFFGNGLPDFANLYSWWRWFTIPGMTHTPQIQWFSLLTDWVEKGIPPDRLTLPSVGSAGGGCPFPQQAKFPGGSISDPANYVCGGNVQTPAVECMLQTTPLGQETSNLLTSYGPKSFPAGCAAYGG
jgi:feruloyl esterase